MILLIFHAKSVEEMVLTVEALLAKSVRHSNRSLVVYLDTKILSVAPFQYRNLFWAN
jgi:hypothetical protein